MEPNHVTENDVTDITEVKTQKMGHMGVNINSAKYRWGKLKTTVAATSHISSKKQRRLDRGDSFLRKFSTRNQAEVDTSMESDDTESSSYRNPKHKTLKSFVIHPSGGLMFYWLGLVTLTVLYNLWTCIAREAFREIQRGYMAMWFCLDAVSDCIYLCDIFVQFRTGYLQQGLMVYDSSKLCRNYLKDKCFIVDILALLPIDFVQFYTGIHPMLRFPRFFKLYRTVRFMHMYESRTAYPNLLRVASLSHILFLGSHWFAAFYYLISEAEGFEGDWSYPKPVGHYAAVTRKYLASLYWSTLTLTTIGDLPPPDTNWQYVFVIVSYLIGVFIFATIVGQVGNVITNRNASRQEFERLLDGAKFYMQMHNVPPDLQKRVQRWYDYVWTRGRLNCNDINSLGLLPDKLKTELALHVNLGTLKKVTIFQKCRPEFLHDLMLKMRAYIFTPGDLICRRGEVAREMFIIADGVVEILGENGTVLTQMSTGDFFGEIGILNLDGGINRRTADVRSVGYSELFVLSREDVLAALKDHPDAEQIIREYGQRRLKETEEHRKMVRSTPSSPDPSSFRGNRGTTKTNMESSNQGMMHFPQVKCFQNLQRLPQMSPKLRKFFTLRNKRIKRRDCRRNSEPSCKDSESSKNTQKNDTIPLEGIHSSKCDHGIKLPVSSLDIIQEKDHSDVEHEDQPINATNTNGSAKLADLVLSLIKSRRQLGYSAVHSEENDAEDQFCNIPIDNIKEISENKCASSQVNYAFSDKFEECKQGKTQEIFQNSSVRRKNGVDNSYHRKDILTNISTPKIILTHDSDQTSSESSSSESEKEIIHETPRPSPTLLVRNHISRKSSPCILPLPTALSDGTGRKFSYAPPLDLPIEVPSFSNFRGLSGGTKEISFSLERFKSQIMQRLDTMEVSNRDTQIRLQETMMFQEKMMRTILKKIAPKEKSKDDALSVTSDATVDKGRVLSRTTDNCESNVNDFLSNPILNSGNGNIQVSQCVISHSNRSKQSASSKSDSMVPSWSEQSRSIRSRQSTKTKATDKQGDSERFVDNKEDTDRLAVGSISEKATDLKKNIELIEDASRQTASETGEKNTDYKVTHL